MPAHQYAIFAEGTRYQLHVEATIRDCVTDRALTEALVAVRSAAEDHRTNGNVNLVVGFGPAAWARLRPAASAPTFDPFGGYASPDGSHEAPATQADIWLWVHGPGADVVIDLARTVVAAIEDTCEVTLDLPTFVHHDSRDLSGFIDGTANVFLDDAPTIATLPAGTPGEGGAYAMTMRFVHDLKAFDALDLHAQERVFGRTKATSESLGAAKPADSHVARAEVDDDDGEEMVVYRRSTPFATATAQGLHFVSFGVDIERFDRQLRSMYGMTDDGIVDALLGYTKAETGSFWFCPGTADLRAIAPVG